MIKIDAEVSWGAWLWVATWTSLYFPVWPELPKILFFQYLISELKAEVNSCVSLLLLLLAKQFASTKSPSNVCHFIWITATYQTRWTHIKKTTYNKDWYPHRPSAETRAEQTKDFGMQTVGCDVLVWKGTQASRLKWKLRLFINLLMMLNTFPLELLIFTHSFKVHKDDLF